MRLMAQTRNLDVTLRDSGFALRAPRNDETFFPPSSFWSRRRRLAPQN